MKLLIQLGITLGQTAEKTVKAIQTACITNASKLSRLQIQELHIEAVERLKQEAIKPKLIIQELKYPEMPRLQVITCINALIKQKAIEKLSAEDSLVVVARILSMGENACSKDTVKALLTKLFEKLKGKEVLALLSNYDFGNKALILLSEHGQINKLSKEELNTFVSKSNYSTVTLVSIMKSLGPRLKELRNETLWQLTFKAAEPKASGSKVGDKGFNGLLEAVANNAEYCPYTKKELEILFTLISTREQGTELYTSFAKLLRKGGIRNFQFNENHFNTLFKNSTTAGRDELCQLVIENKSLHSYLDLLFDKLFKLETTPHLMQVYYTQLEKLGLLKGLSSANQKRAEIIVREIEHAGRREAKGTCSSRTAGTLAYYSGDRSGFASNGRLTPKRIPLDHG